MSLEWLVWDADTPDCSRRIKALDATCAAAEWAEREDVESADYSIVKGNPATVCVRPLHGGPVLTFTVEGRSETHYYAREKR